MALSRSAAPPPLAGKAWAFAFSSIASLTKAPRQQYNQDTLTEVAGTAVPPMTENKALVWLVLPLAGKGLPAEGVEQGPKRPSPAWAYGTGPCDCRPLPVGFRQTGGALDKANGRKGSARQTCNGRPPPSACGRRPLPPSCWALTFCKGALLLWAHIPWPGL